MSEHDSRPPPDDGHTLPYGITMEEIRDRVREARYRVVEPKLGTSLASRLAEDVEQEVLVQVWKTVREGKFDPEKSPLGYWAARIADYRTRDLLKKVRNPRRWEGERLMSEHPNKSVDRQMEEALHEAERGREADHVTIYAELEADRAWLYPLLTTCVQVMDQRKFYRAYLVYFKFDGEVKLAAEHLQQDPAHLRACVRTFRVHLQTVHQALMASRAGAKGTMAEMIDCLPEQDESGGHRRAIAEALHAWVHAGRSLPEVTVEFVAEYTGYQFHTVRQRIGEVLTLLRVAYTVLSRPRADEHQQGQTAA